ncbi:MAG: protein arginine kinase [Candidatus Omnitrophota bacterium]|jgi:protein arginine kinase|nr:protein arginine kinase [Candidatus Omnitrophota bacterium]MDD5526831.1 protein arginine kinase [Candidatus Omnitrophota bacterium]
MNLSDLLNHTSEWLKGSGANSDIVISSRVRLARNIDKMPFPHWAGKKQAETVIEKARALKENVDLLKNTSFFAMSELDSVDKQFLVERHLMSHELSQKPNSKALIVENNEVLSVMVNEEDHLRIQVMQSGFNLKGAWDIVNGLDDAISREVQYAFSREWGYLTACPTNAGTGMRGSVMLHLPALVMLNQINRVLAAIAKLSFTTRGFYGEGTQAAGNFFQISNQVSMGQSEEDLVGNIDGLIRQIIEQEAQAREALLAREKAMLEDRVHRSFGILRNAHIISSKETIELLSMLRLGCELGMIEDLNRSVINELFILIQPAHLQKLENKKLSPEDRDVKRAEIIRGKLNAV